MLWKAVASSQLKDNRNNFEDEVLIQLTHLIPTDLGVTVLADRGFGDVALYDLCDELGYDYVIEWKRSWRDEYLKWLCGFANAQGGVLDVGRNDEGRVVGLENAARLLEELPNRLRDLLGIAG